MTDHPRFRRQSSVADWLVFGADGSVDYEVIQETANHLLSLTSQRPRIGIICGTGLGGLADTLEDTETVDFGRIPHFPIATAPGHVGRLVFGKLGEHSCVCMQGRIHLYEGYPARMVVFPIRVLRAVGVEILIVTNAAGGLNPAYNVGDMMIFKSHVNIPGLAGANPHLGHNDERFGVRFQALSDAYDQELRTLAKQAANDLSFDFVREGTYGMVAGPCYETVAEARVLRMLGADVTGMSSVPEVTTGRHCQMRVLGMTLVTNKCVMDYDTDEVVQSDHVIETGRQRETQCKQFMKKFVSLIQFPS